jgi:hypothetical protein
MTSSTSPMIINEVIDCMSEDREPSVEDLFRVAERIWSEGAANRSAFAWGSLSAAERVQPLRAAQLALRGA